MQKKIYLHLGIIKHNLLNETEETTKDEGCWPDLLQFRKKKLMNNKYITANVTDMYSLCIHTKQTNRYQNK